MSTAMEASKPVAASAGNFPFLMPERSARTTVDTCGDGNALASDFKRGDRAP